MRSLHPSFPIQLSSSAKSLSTPGLLVLMIINLMTVTAFAETNAKSKHKTAVVKTHNSKNKIESKKSNSEKKSELSTDIRFSGQEVGGKYQMPGEAVATVEKEKPLIDLIEPRRDFKDRLRKSVSQR